MIISRSCIDRLPWLPVVLWLISCGTDDAIRITVQLSDFPSEAEGAVGVVIDGLRATTAPIPEKGFPTRFVLRLPRETRGQVEVFAEARFVGADAVALFGDACPVRRGRAGIALQGQEAEELRIEMKNVLSALDCSCPSYFACSDTEKSSREITILAGQAENQLWAVQRELWNHSVLHWDPAIAYWRAVSVEMPVPITMITGPTITSIWPVGNEQLWLASSQGLLYFYDGSRYIRTDTSALPERTNFAAIYGDMHAAWAVGSIEPSPGVTEQVLAQWNGDSWRPWTLPGGARVPVVRAFWGQGPQRIWAAGDGVLSYRDGTWRVEPKAGGYRGTEKLWGIWGTGAALREQIWMVGEGGTVLKFEAGAATWTRQSVPFSGTLRAVMGSSARAIWAVGDDGGVLNSFDGGSEWNGFFIRGRSPISGLWVGHPFDVRLKQDRTIYRATLCALVHAKSQDSKVTFCDPGEPGVDYWGSGGLLNPVMPQASPQAPRASL